MMAGMAVASVALLPWAPSGCAGADGQLALALDATTSAPAPTSCEPDHWGCSTDEMCCSGFCVHGLCADPRPPLTGPRCPASPPRAGTFCSVNGIPLADGIACEYGNSPIPLCDEVFTCRGRQWQFAAPDLSDPACAPNADSCPPSLSDVATEQSCAPLNIHCDYSGSRCECAQNAPVAGWPASWKCPILEGPPISPFGCPAPRPRLGAVCTQLGAACDYGACRIRAGIGQVCLPAGHAGGNEVGMWVPQTVECSCPVSPPDAGDPCTWLAPTACEYGSSPLAECNRVATCQVNAGEPPPGQWTVVVPEAGSPCSPAPASQCPPPDQAIEGTPCATPLLDCDYGGSRCECASGPSRLSTTTTWRCTNPELAGLGCGARPRLGSPCPQDGTSCNYGACEIAGGTFEVCDRGVWTQVTPTCVSCPPTPPEAGTPCTLLAICEYGTSNVYDCDTIALCWPRIPMPGTPATPPGLAWLVSNPDAGGASCQTPPQGACPASFDAVPRDAGCAGAPSFCDYAQGRCRCAAEPGAPGPTWSCQDPAPSCPKPRPRLGSDCWQRGLTCNYDPCGSSDGIAQICASGVWTRILVNCAAGLLDAGSE
jgi:hypothetical protein